MNAFLIHFSHVNCGLLVSYALYLCVKLIRKTFICFSDRYHIITLDFIVDFRVKIEIEIEVAPMGQGDSTTFVYDIWFYWLHYCKMEFSNCEAIANMYSLAAKGNRIFFFNVFLNNQTKRRASQLTSWFSMQMHKLHSNDSNRANIAGSSNDIGNNISIAIFTLSASFSHRLLTACSIYKTQTGTPPRSIRLGTREWMRIRQ